MWTAKIIDKEAKDGYLNVRVQYSNGIDNSEDVFKLFPEDVESLPDYIAAKVDKLTTIDGLMTKVAVGPIDVTTKVEELQTIRSENLAALAASVDNPIPLP